MPLRPGQHRVEQLTDRVDDRPRWRRGLGPPPRASPAVRCPSCTSGGDRRDPLKLRAWHRIVFAVAGLASAGLAGFASARPPERRRCSRRAVRRRSHCSRDGDCRTGAGSAQGRRHGDRQVRCGRRRSAPVAGGEGLRRPTPDTPRTRPGDAGGAEPRHQARQAGAVGRIAGLRARAAGALADAISGLRTDVGGIDDVLRSYADAVRQGMADATKTLTEVLGESPLECDAVRFAVDGIGFARDGVGFQRSTLDGQLSLVASSRKAVVDATSAVTALGAPASVSDGDAALASVDKAVADASRMATGFDAEADSALLRGRPDELGTRSATSNPVGARPRIQHPRKALVTTPDIAHAGRRLERPGTGDMWVMSCSVSAHGPRRRNPATRATDVVLESGRCPVSSYVLLSMANLLSSVVARACPRWWPTKVLAVTLLSPGWCGG